MNHLEKVAKLEREVWYEYAINRVLTGVSNEVKRDYLRGFVRSLRRNYGIPLDERKKYLGMVRKNLEKLK